jgi:hypothetical protein
MVTEATKKYLLSGGFREKETENLEEPLKPAGIEWLRVKGLTAFASAHSLICHVLQHPTASKSFLGFCANVATSPDRQTAEERKERSSKDPKHQLT